MLAIPSPVPVTWLSHGGFNAYACQAACPIGYHQNDTLTGAYVHTPVNGSHIKCTRCTASDTVTCDDICQQGYYRIRGTDQCVPCTVSSACSAGYYAAVCSGNTTANAVCVKCPAAAATHMFVPYSAQSSPNSFRVTHGDCPTACRNNLEFNTGAAFTSTSVCTACSSNAIYASTVVTGADAGFVYSVWNAPAATPWWSVDQTPAALNQHLVQGQAWTIAGVCSPCKIGSDVQPEDTTLCLPMAGFVRAAAASSAVMRTPIPSSYAQMRVWYDEPRIRRVTWSRRLLSVESQPFARRLLGLPADTPVACPTGTFKGRGEGGCGGCPAGRSTMFDASTGAESCLCQPGLVPHASGACLPCPAETYATMPEAGVQPTCLPCGANQTTWGRTGNTRCACAAGYLRAASGVCQPCPSSYYCTPCEDGQPCASWGAGMVPCFRGATSPPGSSSVDNCTCALPGTVPIRSPGGTLACVPLVLGAMLLNDAMACSQGWHQVSAYPNLACTLCEPGFFVPAIGSPCQECPANTYSSSGVAIGECNACPVGQSTAGLTARTSAAGCVCPAGTVKSATTGSCIGCALNQFTNGSTCAPCPPHSVAAQGATSIFSCVCLTGYTHDASGACLPCALGTYFAGSSGGCIACPRGSTTANVGSPSKQFCGASAALCTDGYVFHGIGIGCVNPMIA